MGRLLPPARLLAAVIALGSPYPLALTGGYGVRAHRLANRPSQVSRTGTHGPPGRPRKPGHRALAGMPALRGDAQEAARADLIAVRTYLQKGNEGPLSHSEPARTLRTGEHRLVPYAACLTSGLGRLPS